MQKTPHGLRLHIGLIGKRNVGKSSLLNALTHQKTSIVSPIAGTTTDPVIKAMELQPIGPVVFYDTAGLDDAGHLGASRVSKTNKIMGNLDIALLVVVGSAWDEMEWDVTAQLQNAGTTVIAAFNKCDQEQPDVGLLELLAKRGIPFVNTSVMFEIGIDELRALIINNVPEHLKTIQSITGDIVSPGELAVLVTPIDMEAPRGRLILPEVQVIRDLLDNNALCMVVQETELSEALQRLKDPPRIVITDSQAFKLVAEITPADVLLTSFSILFARFKGDLRTFVEGAKAIEHLHPGDKILIAEACTHHPLEDDIGTFKIPRWLSQKIGGDLDIVNRHGADFPESAEELQAYKLVIHCGACNFNRRQMMSRVEMCREAGVPVTNYGITISSLHGILDRAVKAFGI